MKNDNLDKKSIKEQIEENQKMIDELNKSVIRGLWITLFTTLLTGIALGMSIALVIFKFL